MDGAIRAALDLADGLVAECRLDEAEAVLRGLATREPASVEAHAALAALETWSGRVGGVLQHADRALGLRPEDGRLRTSLADAMAQAQRHGAAAMVLGNASEGIDVRMAHARAAERRDRPELALWHWTRALALEPDHAAAQLGAVRSLRLDGRYDEAEDRLASLLEANAGAPRLHAEHARIAFDRGDPCTAERRWHGALLAAPGQAVPISGLAQALSAQHRFSDARALLEAAIRRDGRRPELRFRLITTLLAEGDLELAAHACRMLLADHPAPLAHRLLRGRIAERKGLHAEAMRHYRDLAAACPQAPQPLLAAAELAARQADAVTACELLQAVLALEPEHAEAWTALAGALDTLGETEAARDALRKAVALAPRSPQPRIRLALMAEAWGDLVAVRLALLEVLSALPHREEPLAELVQLALRHGRFDAAAEHAARLADRHPKSLSARLLGVDVALALGDEARARGLVTALGEELPEHREVLRRQARLDWLEGAVARARWRAARADRFDLRLHGGPDVIERLDRNEMPPPDGEVRAFLLVRNEAVRLPWLLAYYRGLGVDRFLVLDNGSDDGTRDLLLGAGSDVHLFATEGSFAASGAGMRWTNRLLDEHGSGAWCLTVDADEVLTYPEVERCSIKRLTAYLDAVGAEALVAPMIDMYAPAPLDEVAYAPGANLIEAFPCFDAEGYVRREANDFPYFRLLGGARARLFYGNPDDGPVLQKVPLIRWAPDLKYLSSKHTAFPCRLPDISGALLHFKYLPDFARQVEIEVARGQHYSGAKEYRTYARRLREGQSLSFTAPVTRRYAGSAQLVGHGLMRSSPAFERFVEGGHDG